MGGIRWSVFIWKSQRILCISFSMTAGLWLYHLLVIFPYLAKFSVDHFPYQVELVQVFLLCYLAGFPDMINYFISITICFDMIRSYSIILCYYNDYYFTPFEFSHWSVCWGFFMEVWVTASHQDSSQYSGRSPQCCNLVLILPLISKSSL